MRLRLRLEYNGKLLIVNCVLGQYHLIYNTAVGCEPMCSPWNTRFMLHYNWIDHLGQVPTQCRLVKDKFNKEKSYTHKIRCSLFIKFLIFEINRLLFFKEKNSHNSNLNIMSIQFYVYWPSTAKAFWALRFGESLEPN